MEISDFTLVKSVFINLSEMHKDTYSGFNSWKRQSVQDITVALLVLFLPFISFFHLLFSSELTSLNLFIFQIDHGFPDNQVFAWFILMQFSSFAFTLLMLLFSKGYWKYALLIPIYYFLAYPFWMFTDTYEQFSNYVLSGYGLLLMVLVVLAVLKADATVKTKLVNRDIRLTFEAGCRELFEAWNSRCNLAIRKTLNRKAHLTLHEYIQRIYFYAVLVEKQEDRNLKQNNYPKRRWSKFRAFMIFGILISLILMLFVHHWIPSEQTRFEILGFEIGSFGFRDSGTFLFYSLNKFTLCILGLIWFATSKHWWRGAILSPILFYLYQFCESFYPTTNLDGEGNLNIMPLVLIAILSVILLWALIRRISENRDYKDFLKRELEASLQELSREEARGSLFQIKVYNPEIL